MPISALKKFKHSIQAIAVLIGTFILISFPYSLYAAIYYIDATGGKNTNTGLSEATAWKTIAKVNSSRFNPGDQILFNRGGIWRETLVVPSSGIYKNQIVFTAYGSGSLPAITGSEVISGWSAQGQDVYKVSISWKCNQILQNGERLIRKTSLPELTPGSWYIDLPNMMLYMITRDRSHPSLSTIEASKRDKAIYVYGKSYVKIDGFNVYGTNNRGAMYLGTQSRGGQIVNNSVHHNYGGGILIEDGSNGNTISNNIISYSHYAEGDFQFYNSNGIAVRTGSNNNIISNNKSFSNYGSGVFIRNSSNNLVDNNNIHDNGAGGVDINDPESQGNLVKNNTVYKNGQIDTDEQGISFFNPGPGNVARGNIVYEQKGGPNDGVGILIDTTSNQVVIEQNIVFNNSGHGLGIWKSKSGILRNNTSYGNSKNGIFVGGSDSAGTQVVNNISVNNSGYQLSFQPDAAAAGGYLISHNNFYKSGAQKVIMFNDRSYSAADFNAAYPGLSILQVDPLFVSPITDFRLSPASPCINQGQDVGLSYTGKAPDLGAYEYSAIPLTPTNPTQ